MVYLYIWPSIGLLLNGKGEGKEKKRSEKAMDSKAIRSLNFFEFQSGVMDP